MNTKRRTLLKGTLATGALAVAAGAGLLKPARVLAAEWPKNAFDARSVDDAVKALFNASGAENKGIVIKAPAQAENGAVVPISVETSMPNVETISIMVKENDRPLATSVSLGNGAAGYYGARIKMAKTSDITVFVKAGGKVYFNTQQIKVTAGGCGG